MDRLTLYRASQAIPLGYRGKILLLAFLGTHVPLLALVAYVAPRGDRDAYLAVLGMALVATLVGTALTLTVLGGLLEPVALTSRALRAWRERREPAALPTGFRDQVGTLMADAQVAMAEADAMVDALAHVDQATGLPNRRRLEQRLAEAASSVTVGVIRFDDHATLLRTLGHDAAEGAARTVADRLATRIEGLARIGPDAFAGVIHGDPVAALRGAVAQGALAVGDIAVQPTLRAGYATSPADAEAPAALVDAALAAAGHATDADPVVAHDPAARRRATERLRFESELRRGIENGELELHYQPIIDATRGRAVGAEALVRWRHPQRGLVGAGEFVPLAEETGLVEPLGWWVLEQACARLAALDAAPETAGLRPRISVNLSARQLRAPDLPRRVLDAIESFRLSPDRLELELTETAAMADHDHTRAIFTRLRDAGVKLAIDDFGSGWSSLSYLRRLPFDKLKIDREFVTDCDRKPTSEAICRALMELGLEVLAEGTESADEVRMLRDRGCALFQGFWFSKPVPAAELGAMLSREYPLPI